MRTVVADTLGRDMQSAPGLSVDLARATSSVRVCDMSTILAIGPPIPAGVTGVQFLVDVESCQQDADRRAYLSRKGAVATVMAWNTTLRASSSSKA